MLFHSFKNQEERRAFGGGDFVEFQTCRLKPGTSLREILSNPRLAHWEDDSLYVCGDDCAAFYAACGAIFTGGFYGNLESGPLDWCGLNYFTPEQSAVIVQRLRLEQPPDCGLLLEWLEQGSGYNGFYVLGI